MRKIPVILSFLGLLLLQLAAAESVQMQLEPQIVTRGEEFYLILSSEGKSIPELQEIPAGFQLRGSSQSVQIINGRRSNQISLLMQPPDKPGQYDIGPLKVKLGADTVLTDKQTLTVHEAPENDSASEQCFLRSKFGVERKSFYVGESIPLTISLFYQPDLDLEPSYPVLDIGKSVFADYRQVNRRNKDFALPQQRRAVIDNKVYGELIFTTAFRALAPGKLQVTGTVPCRVRVPVSRRNRSFMNNYHYREIQRDQKVLLPEITVLPLPEVPAGKVFTNLVGQYAMQCQVDKTQLNALEPLSLKVLISGQGSAEGFKAPELKLDSCRVYPGKVRNLNNALEIDYVIIPLKSGELPLALQWCFFDPESGSYKDLTFAQKITVDPAQNVTAATVDAAPISDSGRANDDIQNNNHTTLLYCKKSPQSGWSQFFRRNRLILAYSLLIASMIVVLATWLTGRFTKKSRRDPEELRRKKAAAYRNTLASRVQKVDDAGLPRLVTGEVADFLSDRWLLPAGSTPEEVADQAYDPELADVLRECSNTSYLPPELAGRALRDPDRIRKIVLKALKILLLHVAIFCTLPLTGAESKLPESWHEALKAYDKGDYSASRAYFEKYAAEHPADPHVLYNLGCISEAENKPELALYFFEAAARLDPADRDTLENRNVMRRKLLLPVDSGNTPQAVLATWRDCLHWEEYCLFGAAGVFIFCVIMCLRKRISQTWRWALSSAAVGWIVIVLLALLSLTWSNKPAVDGMVVVPKAEIYSFPVSQHAEVVGSLFGGSEVEIIEERSRCSLVRSGNTEGWVLNGDIRRYPR